jgi:signal peptidase I
VYHHPCSGSAFVGRVMAIGGDSIEVRCDVVWLNGKALPLELVDAKATYLEHFEYSVPAEQHQAASYREVIEGHAHLVFEAADRPERAASQELAAESMDFPGIVAETCASNPDRLPDYRPSADQVGGEVVVARDAAAATGPCAPFRHYVVPRGHFFVLGDNRHNANDSRFWGSVPFTNIVGRVTGRWYPLSRAGGVD